MTEGNRAQQLDQRPAARESARWQTPVLLAALAVGILFLAIQLWLLTVALDLLLAGEGRRLWQIAVVSGFIFLGGLLVLWLLQRNRATRFR